MNFAKNIRKYASILGVSVLTGAAGSAAIADDAGYHAEQLERIQAQTGQLLDQGDPGLTLSDAKSVTRASGSSATKRRERAEDDESLTSSQKLWKRFDRVTGRH